jgi:hypothetical protein
MHALAEARRADDQHPRHSAAALALWLLINASSFWSGPSCSSQRSENLGAGMLYGVMT